MTSCNCCHIPKIPPLAGVPEGACRCMQVLAGACGRVRVLGEGG